MRPMIDVEVIGSKSRAKFKALIDTGFSGCVCIPSKTAEELGLVLIGEEEFELANGQWITQFFFGGKVHFLGKTEEATILVSKSPTALIGADLLKDCRLTIDYPTNKVRLTRKSD